MPRPHQHLAEEGATVSVAAAGRTAAAFLAPLRSDCSDGVAALLAPRSVAIVGATPRVDALGGRPIANLQTHGFEGRIYPVNPRYKEVLGLRSYPDLASLPEAPDLVLVLVGGERVFDALDQAVAAGAKVALVFSAGFAENGGDGVQKQARLLRYRDLGLRICGPNCNGIFSVANKTALGFSPAFEIQPRRGAVALISQSGGVATCAASRGMEMGVGFSHIIASGNEADLEMSDYVEHLLDDPHTRVFTLFVEGLKNTPRFLRLAEEALRRGKPIVAMKMGRSASSQRVALSHTGSMTGPSDVIEGALRQKGVVLADSLDDLYGIAALFATGKRPRRGRIAVASLSGGMAGIIADACEFAGVELAGFAPETCTALEAQLPGVASLANPLDMTGQVVNEPDRWRSCLEAMNGDPDVDLVASVLSITANKIERRFVRDMLAAAEGTDTAQICIWPSGMPEGSGIEDLRAGTVPFYARAEDAVKAVAAWNRYWLTREPRLAALADMPAPPPAGRLGPASGWELLAKAGIPMPRQAFARSRQELEAALAGFMFPVALKVEAESIAHKTEANAVRLGLRSPGEALAAYEELSKGPLGTLLEDGRARVQVQEMVVGRREIILGLKAETGMGMAVTLGVGGIFAELNRDRSVRLAPLSAFDPAEMVAELRSAPMLGNFRGMGPVAESLVTDLLLKMSRLAEIHAGEIAELDVNPLILRDDGSSGVAVDVLLVRHKTNDEGEAEA